MRVSLLTSFVGTGFSWKRGEVVELPERSALRLIAAGQAVEAGKGKTEQVEPGSDRNSTPSSEHSPAPVSRSAEQSLETLPNLKESKSVPKSPAKRKSRKKSD